MKSTHVAITIAAAFLLALSPLGTDAAVAEEPTVHCWQDVESGDGACYDTVAEVLADIAEHAEAGRAGTDAGAQDGSVGALSTVVIGQVFEDLNYGGSSYTFTASADCDTNADVDWELSSMPSGWNDRVSSFKSFGQCATKIWHDVGYAGTSYGFVANSTYVGATLNDEASSIQWN